MGPASPGSGTPDCGTATAWALGDSRSRSPCDSIQVHPGWWAPPVLGLLVLRPQGWASGQAPWGQWTGSAVGRVPQTYRPDAALTAPSSSSLIESRFSAAGTRAQELGL